MPSKLRRTGPRSFQAKCLVDCGIRLTCRTGRAAPCAALVIAAARGGSTSECRSRNNPERKGAPDPGEEQGSLPLLVLLACVVGAGAGAIGTLFRLCLEHADPWRDALIGWAHVAPIVGFVLVTAGCASAVALAAWLVRRFSPEASGSGIPHVEAVLRQDVPPAPLSVLPVKFSAGCSRSGPGWRSAAKAPAYRWVRSSPT